MPGEVREGRTLLRVTWCGRFMADALAGAAVRAVNDEVDPAVLCERTGERDGLLAGRVQRGRVRCPRDPHRPMPVLGDHIDLMDHGPLLEQNWEEGQFELSRAVLMDIDLRATAAPGIAGGTHETESHDNQTADGDPERGRSEGQGDPGPSPSHEEGSENVQNDSIHGFLVDSGTERFGPPGGARNQKWGATSVPEWMGCDSPRFLRSTRGEPTREGQIAARGGGVARAIRTIWREVPWRERGWGWSGWSEAAGKVRRDLTGGLAGGWSLASRKL